MQTPFFILSSLILSHLIYISSYHISQVAKHVTQLMVYTCSYKPDSCLTHVLTNPACDQGLGYLEQYIRLSQTCIVL